MSKKIAFYTKVKNSELWDELKTILDRYHYPYIVCPDKSRRESLLWLSELNSDDIALVIVLEEGNGDCSAAASQILAADIPVVIFPRTELKPKVLMALLEKTTALVLPQGEIRRLFHVISWFNPGGATRVEKKNVTPAYEVIDWEDESFDFLSDVITPVRGMESQPLSSEAQGQWGQKLKDSEPTDEGDRYLLERLEKLMGAAVKKREEKPEAAVQPSGLDFSLPLRKIMSEAWSVAKKAKHPEVWGVHYLAAAFDTGAGESLKQAGIHKEQLDEFLTRFDTNEMTADESVMSDEGFDAVGRAKEIARLSGGSYVVTADFLQAVVAAPTGSVRDFLEEYGLEQKAVADSIARFHAEEPTDNGFFKPGSLDQAAYAEFDAENLKLVQERLESLKGFQEAAQPQRKRYAKSTASKPAENGAVRVLPQPPAKPEVVRYSGEFPPIDLMEDVADMLLEGHLIAFASDLYFALAADASNPAAVERLRAVAGIDPERAIAVQIHSASLLRHLTSQKSDRLERLLDHYWPGPLTVVMEKQPGSLTAVSSGSTFGVRIPSDNLSLGILSMFGRPLAVTSVNLSGAIHPDADLVAEYVKGKAALVIQGDVDVINKETTVLSVAGDEWEILRPGGISDESIREILETK